MENKTQKKISLESGIGNGQNDAKRALREGTKKKSLTLSARPSHRMRK